MKERSRCTSLKHLAIPARRERHEKMEVEGEREREIQERQIIYYTIQQKYVQLYLPNQIGGCEPDSVLRCVQFSSVGPGHVISYCVTDPLL